MRWISRIVAALLAAPLLTLLWLSVAGEPLPAAVARNLTDYALNSLLVMLGAGGLALSIGAYGAWFVARYNFPLRRLVQWGLMLPLALPPYLLAMVYGHQLDVAGPVQATLRSMFHLQVGDYWFPNILSLAGAVCVLGFSLYPYVYLAARQAFAAQSQGQFEAAWLGGLPPRKWLWRIAMPAARPALALGVALVMMESLADFGVVSLLGVTTFTTAIYTSWSSLGDPYSAAKLALMLLAFVAGALWLEQSSRRHLQDTLTGQQEKHLERLRLGKAQGLLVCVACLLPVCIGFVVPFAQLLVWAASSQSQWLDKLHWQAAAYGVLVATLVAFLALVLALVLAYRLRARPARPEAALIKASTLGYAVPGSVVAVAIFIPLLWLDKSLADASQWLGKERIALLFTGSIAAMVIACTIRFLAVAMSSVQSGLQQLPHQSDDAARLLGVSGFKLVRLLHVPQLKYAILGGAFMVFAETLKELPASILLRPFDVSTLSIRTYELALDGRLVQASVPALMMASIGLVAVLLLMGLQRARAEDITAQT